MDNYEVLEVIHASRTSIDVDKLRYLKNVSLIEANTNMTIFTKSFLKSQFKECSAFYNHNTDVYIFSGKKIAVECIYNEKDELFVVNRIMPLSVDRRISNQKRGFIIDEEFEVLLKYLADKCENCKINVYHLDDWAKSEWCSKVLSVLNGKKLSEIGYAECYDFRKALSIIQRTMPECSRDKIVQVKTEYYLSLVFDEKYIITGVAKDIVIMDSNTHIHKVEFYLQVM